MDNKNLKDNITSQQTIYEKKTQLAALNKNPKNAMDYSNNLSILLNVMGFRSLRPNQTDAVSYLFTGQDLLFVSATGGGKCEAPGTLIRMYDGSIKKIEDIQIGNKVMGPDGTPRNVLETHSGYGTMYKISYGKDYKYSQIVNENHTMILHLRNWGSLGNRSKKRVRHPVTKQYIDQNEYIYIMAKDLYEHGTKYFIHSTGICFNKEQTFEKKCIIDHLPIDPYILGSWLGDGTSNTASITSKDKVILDYWKDYATICGDSIRVTEKFNKDLNRYSKAVTLFIHNSHNKGSFLFKNLQKLNLLNNKHIPDCYKFSSVTHRKQLLAGILDTDGYVTKNSIEIAVKSDTLAQDIIFLAQSLGIQVTKNKKIINWKNEKELSYNRLYLKNYWVLKDLPFKLLKLNGEKCKTDTSIATFKIEKIEGENHPYYGFSLDGDHLYLHADGLITHNSMVYISAAICMQLKTIIFSPLVSLIQDQADNLRSKGFKVGVINSAVTPREKSLAVALWESGDLDFLFVAPERLQNQDFLNVMVKSPPDFIVVDEIHCAYEHGDNFRASYKLIAPFVKAMKPKLFLGLTATMSPEVEEAVRRIFDLQDTKKICKSYKRDNLHFHTVKNLDGLSSYDIDGMLLNEVNKPNKDGELVPTIVYCSTAAMVNKLYQTFGKSVKGGAMMYTGDMSPAEKESNQMRFLQNKIRVAFATNAFGMGIDHPSIGKVIFRTFPSSLEELIQGFGRGGRNGCICDCILYADKTTLNTQKFFIDIGYPSRHIIESFYRGLKMLADEENLVYATLADICNTVSIPTTFSSALTQILQGSNIIKRTTIIPESKIRVLDSPPESDKLHKKFETYVSKIEYVGTEEDGYLSFDINFLAKEMGIGVETVKKVLKSFDQLGFIKYIPAARNSPLQIIGDIKTLDFKYLDQKRVEKETKLEEVVEFVDVPDKDKGDFLDDYFDLTNNK